MTCRRRLIPWRPPSLGPSGRAHHPCDLGGCGDTLTLIVAFSEMPRTVSRCPRPEDGPCRRRRVVGRRTGTTAASSTSPAAPIRAPRELERRVVLSHISARSTPPASSRRRRKGLFSNSWNGKFHLEMHLWHAVTSPCGVGPSCSNGACPGICRQLPEAQARGPGATASPAPGGRRWPGPEGRNSPSTVTPFIMWQQPHPIYLAEPRGARSRPRDARRYGERWSRPPPARLLAAARSRPRATASVRRSSRCRKTTPR